MNYFKKQDGSIWAFDDDQLDLVHDDIVAMTDVEIDQHLNPQNYWSDEQKEAERLKQFLPLTRRQFKLTLLENDLLETIESKIELIEDSKQKSRIQIEYLESEKFERQSELVIYMINMLELSAEQVDAMWLHAMSL